jgi:hypothetical protein
MNKRKKQTILLLGILIILVLSAFILRKNYWTGGTAFSDFAVTDTANVTMVFLSDREGNSVTLERLSPSQWRLNKTNDANSAVVGSLLRTLYNIEIKGMVPRSAHNTVISDMAAKNTKIEIYQRVPRIKMGRVKLFPRVILSKVYFVGGPTQDHLGTFMMLEGSDKAFITYVPGQNAFLSLRYSTRESDWRDHTIIALTINQIQSVDVEIPGRPEESYKIVKSGDKSFDVFQYYNQPVTIPLDTIRILDFMASFRNLKYEGLINDMDPMRRDSIINSTPMQVLTITAIDGGVYTISTFRRKSPYEYDEVAQKELKWDRDRLYALINEGKDLTLCQFYAFDDILKPFTWFRADFKPEDPLYFYEDEWF